MSVRPPDIDAADAMLAEAAKADLVLMRHVQSLALEASEPQAVGTLVHAYARVSRAMRQNLALLAKQKSDRAKEAREAARREAWLDRHPDERSTEDLAIQERAEALHNAVGRVISAASQGDEDRHTELVHRFDRELDDWSEAPDFLTEDLATQVQTVCRRLGLPADLATRWPDLPDPNFFPDPEPAEARTPARPPADPGPPHAGTPSTDQAAPPIPWRNSS